MQKLISVWIWSAIILLIIFWLPLLAIRRLFEFDKTHYKTGRLFRKLGLAISRINPGWHIHIEGKKDIDDRAPYVMVSNHLSNADIPVISNLPWEMKWIAKKELFNLPVVGWMMRLAGDISVDRSAANKRVGVFNRSKYYLENRCSVIFFPEGTRSRTGKLNKFAPGAFDLAIRQKVPILPIVVDGTRRCLPKKDWVFNSGVNVKLKILDPVETKNLPNEDGIELMNRVRNNMMKQLAEWRNVPVTEVDGLHQAD